MSARYILQQDETGQFRFTLATHSGQVLLTSVPYTDKDSALRGVDSARHLAHNERNYQLLTIEDGSSYFVVRSARKEVIAQSDIYADTDSLRGLMIAVKAVTRGARLEDLTDKILRPDLRPVKLW